MMILRLLISIIIILCLCCVDTAGKSDIQEDDFTKISDKREDEYEDKTDYSEYSKCGDLVLHYEDSCYCGDRTLGYSDSNYCCVPPSKSPGQECKIKASYDLFKSSRYKVTNRKTYDVSCAGGEEKKSSKTCYGKCYNSYEDSETIGPDAQYHCTASDKCIPVDMLCKGVEFCSSLSVDEFCDQRLRCNDRKQILKNITTSLVEEHYYCYTTPGFVVDENDGVYDSVDRMDETLNKTEVLAYNINWSEVMKPCSTQDNNIMDGIDCGTDLCINNFYFCGAWVDTGLTCIVGSISIELNDKQLCNNLTAWNTLNITCNIYNSDGLVQFYGSRCRGSHMECQYPWYGKHDKTLPNPVFLTTNCQDKSAEQFPTNTSCSKFNEKFLKEWTDNFCKDQSCIDEAKLWFSEQTSNTILDPHNCQKSCGEEDQTGGCKACSNPLYFKCDKSNTCLHPHLKCDGHKQCPNGEDEDLNMCKREYIKKNIIDLDDTFRCTSTWNNQTEIVGTACNGVVGCSDGSDEQNCSTNSDMLLIVSSLGILSIFFLLRLSTYIQKKYRGSPEKYEMYENSRTLISNYENDHDYETAIKQVSSYLLHVLYSKKALEKNEICTVFYNIEAKFHEDDESEIFTCLHNRLDPKVVKMILDAVYPGVKQAIANLLEKNSISMWMTNLIDVVTHNQAFNKIVHLITASFRLLVVYIDLFKDSLLAYTIFTLSGGLKALLDFPTNFSSALVFCFSTTIIFNLLITSLHLTINHPGLMIYKHGLKRLTGLKRKFLHVINIMTSFLNPLLLANTCETALDDLKTEATKGPSEKVLTLAKTCQAFMKIKSDFVRIKLILEVFYQTASLIVLWNFSDSKSKTTDGLETIFGGSSTFFGIPFSPKTVLILSIIWSVKTCISSHIRVIATENQFLGLKAKAVIFLWAACSTCRRILSMVMFWTPSFGLFGILSHWLYEQIGFKARLDYADQIMPSDKIQLRGLKEEILWTQLDRWCYDDPDYPEPPPYSIYTGLTIKETMIAFMALSFIHCLVLGLVKYKTSEKFRNPSEKVLNKMLHLLEGINLSHPFQDWDQEETTVPEFRRRHKDVIKEMVACMLTNSVFSFIKLIPIWFTGKSHDNIELKFKFFKYLSFPNQLQTQLPEEFH